MVASSSSSSSPSTTATRGERQRAQSEQAVSSSWHDTPTSLLVSLSAAALILAAFVVRSAGEIQAPSQVSSSPFPGDLGGIEGELWSTAGLDRRDLSALACPVSSLDDLHPLERSPRAYALSSSRRQHSRNDSSEQPHRRHATPPPSNVGGSTSLVCCQTTAGPLSVAVHTNWAPHGAGRFLDMVRSGYFDAAAPFHRCNDGGVAKSGTWCEFSAGGRTGRRWRDSEINDDPDWLLPVDGDREALTHKGETGKAAAGDGGAEGDAVSVLKRLPRGSLAFAPPASSSSAPGANRTHHLSLTVTDADGVRTSSTPSGGHRPWEVPFGELVHPSSYATLERLFTGYGENGPSDRDVMASGGGMDSDFVETFPNMDYMLGCQVVAEETVGAE